MSRHGRTRSSQPLAHYNPIHGAVNIPSETDPLLRKKALSYTPSKQCAREGYHTATTCNGTTYKINNLATEHTAMFVFSRNDRDPAVSTRLRNNADIFNISCSVAKHHQWCTEPELPKRGSTSTYTTRGEQTSLISTVQSIPTCMIQWQ